MNHVILLLKDKGGSDNQGNPDSEVRFSSFLFLEKVMRSRGGSRAAPTRAAPTRAAPTKVPPKEQRKTGYEAEPPGLASRWYKTASMTMVPSSIQMAPKSHNIRRTPR